MSALPPRTRRLSTLLELLAYLGMAGITLAGLYISLDPAQLTIDRAAGLRIVGPLWPVGPLAQALIVVMFWVSLCALLYTLWHMGRLFRLYRRDRPLSETSARTTRHIGLGFAAQGLLGVFGGTIEGLILSIDAPVGQRMISVAVDSQDVAFLLAGGVLVLIGLVMAQAMEAVRENEAFV